MEKQSNTKFAILGLLTTGCRTGYSMKQMMDGSLNHFWKISYGQIYPTLKSLLDEKLITVQKQSESGKPDKKEYELTQLGWDALKKWMETPVEEVALEKNELLLKLFFSHHQSDEVVEKQLESYLSKLLDRFKTYEAIEEMIIQTYGDQEDAKFWLMTLDYGKRTTKAAIEWAKDAKIKL
ncbi:PadR family transcriptional regulator [Guptibacillus hwajinpoensis]|uniref:PadR family transcriptional regulator n=1 Tax=Guptibacillus hwajinpoensis TaxID=208199 RepID=UPI001CFD277C|nr:PadR family transcriptional regulator [Pseudalkalibacillus hwajinpoensis]WLR61237.1 PadR family transcriptional regulator [Pseudalkalibacillus hwajinpoensis]